MKKSLRKIYLEAAESIAQGIETYSCVAIENICHYDNGKSPASRLLTYIFHDDRRISFLRQLEQENLDTRKFRVLMLCMAAACYRDFLPRKERS